MLDWDRVRAALAHERLPALVIDADALDHNVACFARAVPSGKTIRVGSKSLRSRALLRHVLAAHPSVLRGVLAFTYDEASWLLSGGERVTGDVLVAYPSMQRAALAGFVQAARSADRALAIVDAIEHVEALEALTARDAPLDVAIDLDVSLHRAGLHLGVRRSPIRGASAAVELARRIERGGRLTMRGMLAYEAHVAGLAGNGPVQRAFRAGAFPEVARLRRETLAALSDAGFTLDLVNGGGTGSTTRTLSDPSVTELTVGSGFLCSHLFDGASDLDLRPAIYVACEVDRVPDADHVTLQGGGYVASGEAGPSRLPIPAIPAGLSLTSIEGAGEVQTPLSIRGAARAPRIGDVVLLRPAKAGEIAERFREHLWIAGDRIVARTPTYRGEGQAFL